MFNTPNIIVLLTIGNEQKTISLVQPFAFSSIYDIVMDKAVQGQVQIAGRGWTVNTIAESPIQKEHYQALVDAINNAIGYTS